MDAKRLHTTMDETYQDVEMLVHKICHEFLARKGVSESDYDEWQAEASLAFVNAFHTFDRRLGTKFSTWLWNCIWNALMNKLRKEVMHQRIQKLDHDELDKLIDKRVFDHPEELDLAELSDDAKALVRIVIDLFGHVDGRKRKPANVRVALQAFLANIGWSWQRIAETFREIKTVLLNES